MSCNFLWVRRGCNYATHIVAKFSLASNESRFFNSANFMPCLVHVCKEEAPHMFSVFLLINCSLSKKKKGKVWTTNIHVTSQKILLPLNHHSNSNIGWFGSTSPLPWNDYMIFFFSFFLLNFSLKLLGSYLLCIGISFDKMHFTYNWLDLRCA